MNKKYLFNTGDLLLFTDYDSLFYKTFNDIGMIIIDPPWNDRLVGHYLIKGIHKNNKGDIDLINLDDIFRSYKGIIYWRSMRCKKDIKFNENLINTYYTITCKKYPINIYSWFYLSFMTSNINKKKMNGYWSASIITFIYLSLNLINNIDWMLIKPNKYKNNSNIKFINCELKKEVLIFKFE